jgi:hypothetical protein
MGVVFFCFFIFEFGVGGYCGFALFDVFHFGVFRWLLGIGMGIGVVFVGCIYILSFYMLLDGLVTWSYFTSLSEECMSKANFN